MARRVRFSLASAIVFLFLICLLLAFAAYVYPVFGHPWLVFSFVLAELVFWCICLALLHVVGRHTGYRFAVGFVLFALTHWIMDEPRSPSPLSFEEGPALLHSVFAYRWFERIGAGGKLDVGPFKFVWNQWSLNLLVRSGCTLIAGVMGGLYAELLNRQKEKSRD